MNQNKLVEALQLIANSNTKLPDEKNVLKAQLIWIRSVAASALKEHAANNEGWVRVEDRLPKDRRTVLFYIPEYMNMSTGHYCMMDKKINIDDEFIIGTPTHWQPLPTPPTE